MVAKRAKFKVEEIAEDKPVAEVPASVEVVEEVNETPEASPTPEAAKETVSVVEPKSSQDEIKEWLKDVKPDTSKEVEKGSTFNGKIVLVAIVIVLIVGAIVGGVFYYKKGVTNPKTDDKPQPLPVTVVPTTTEASPTTTQQEVALKDLKVQVLNGSGKVGEAGVVKTALTKAGFTAGNITTGNASSYNFTDTEVSLKEGISDSVFNDIKKALGENYSVVQKDNLGASASFDVVITVGKAK